MPQTAVHRWVLPQELADALRCELVQVAGEIVEEVRRGVPEFERRLQGGVAAGVRLGVERGLRRFIDQ
ncbi:hypothetical protein ACRYCC_37775, partial [Actinomadura scrupuli]